MAEELKEIKRRDRGVVVPPHKAVPYAPENIHLSKTEFIAKRKVEKEKALKIAEFAANLDTESKPKEVEKVTVAKPRGRPKRIE